MPVRKVEEGRDRTGAQGFPPTSTSARRGKRVPPLEGRLGSLADSRSIIGHDRCTLSCGISQTEALGHAYENQEALNDRRARRLVASGLHCRFVGERPA